MINHQLVVDFLFFFCSHWKSSVVFICFFLCLLPCFWVVCFINMIGICRDTLSKLNDQMEINKHLDRLKCIYFSVIWKKFHKYFISILKLKMTHCIEHSKELRDQVRNDNILSLQQWRRSVWTIVQKLMFDLQERVC